ncbi:hypothetical protein BJX99DRAFT_265418 [Aspergillus californicus]
MASRIPRPIGTNAISKRKIATAVKTEATPTNEPRRYWIFYDVSTPNPTIGDRAHGYCELADGFIFSSIGTVLEESVIPRAVIVLPPFGEGRGSFQPITRPSMVNTRKDEMLPEVGEVGFGFYEPYHGAGVICYGEGEVVAVLENVRIFLISRAGDAQHPLCQW